jgi:hypothetical protein
MQKMADLEPAALAWHTDVVAVSSAGENGERREAIERRLDALDIDWRHAAFEHSDEKGINLLADIGGEQDAPLLLLGAHFDKVAVGDGATDNASGSAVVLALAERLKQQPLANHRVIVAFWDLEERGLLGAHAYIGQKQEQPLLYVNFDVFGWGDTLWMMSPETDSPIAIASRQAADAAGIALTAGDQYPPTDHGAFLKAGWPAVSFSLVGGDEIEGILGVYDGKKPKTLPKVMRVIHSKHDTVAYLDATAVMRGVDAVEDALRRWDVLAVEQE